MLDIGSTLSLSVEFLSTNYDVSRKFNSLLRKLFILSKEENSKFYPFIGEAAADALFLKVRDHGSDESE